MMTFPRAGWALGLAVAALAGCDPRTELSNLPPTLALSNTALNPVGTIGGAAVLETVTIVNGTEGELDGIAVETQYLGTATGWLATTLDRTSATRDQSATLQVRSTPGSLGLGVYLANVRVSAPGSGNGPIVIAVRFTVDPRPPAKISVLTQPSTTSINGSPFARQPVVQLLDALDQPTAKAGIAITASLPAGATGQLIGATSILTDANGRAAFTDLGILGPVGDRTLTFSAPNLATATSASIRLDPGAAVRLEAVTASSQGANAGSNVTAPPRVRAVDGSGNGVAGIAVLFTANPGSTIVPAGTITTGADGSAGLTSWTLSQTAGTNTVTAAVTGLAGSPITFTGNGSPGPLVQLVKVSGDNLLGLVGSTLATPHVVRAIDQFGNGIAGVAIGWSVTGGGSTTPTTGTTDATGLTQTTRTLPATPGPLTTTATAGTLTAVFSATAANAGPAVIVKVSGDNQSGQVGTQLATPIRVQILDATSAPLANVTVNFTTPNGGSFPGGATRTTDASGFAQTTWQLGPGGGQQTAQAAVGGPAPAVFTATATAGPLSLTQSTIAVSPGTITAGSGTSTVTVTAKDALGNPIGGLSVTLSNSGGGALTQPSAVTNGAGQATGTYTSTSAGAKVVSATIASQTLPQTATITVAPGAAATMVALTATSFAVRFGQPVSPLPSVQVRDAFGNGVPGVSITFSITSGQSTSSPASTSTNAAGTASLSSWLIGAFTGASPQNVFNRISASTGLAITGNPITFTGTATVSFASDLDPFFKSAGAAGSGGCAGASCHNGTSPVVTQTTANLYATLLNVNQRYVIPNDSTNSSTTTNLLWRKLSGLQSHTGLTRPSDIVTVIKAWIRQGAPNN